MKHKSTIAFISLIIIILFIPLIFSSCKGKEIKEYNGKEIAYIEYEICDFMGGATYNQYDEKRDKKVTKKAEKSAFLF